MPTLYEKGDRLARHVLTEHGFGEWGTRHVLHELTLSGPKPITLTPEELAEWTRLDVDGVLPQAGASSCLNCRRINFGPCISRTCEHLQVWSPEWVQ